MKNTNSGLLFTVIFTTCLFACSKNSSRKAPDSGSRTLTLSQSTVKKGQPLVITSAGESPGISWSVSPSAYAHVSSGNNQAMVLFAKPGTYQVTASYAGSDADSSTSSPVTVTDSVYTPPPSSFDTLSLTGDQVTLTPMWDSGSNLILLAQSSNQYDCWSYFLYGIDGHVGGGIDIQFYNVISGSLTGNCGGARNPAASYLFLNNFVKGLADGDYPFSVTLNSVKYGGTITLTHDNLRFTWDHPSGVHIAPLVIQRP